MSVGRGAGVVQSFAAASSCSVNSLPLHETRGNAISAKVIGRQTTVTDSLESIWKYYPSILLEGFLILTRYVLDASLLQ
jgi:hypothetical protein